MSSNPVQEYAVLTEVKFKLNISTSDTSQDIQITVATNDANNYIAEQTIVHAALITAGDDPSLSSMANNLAAAYFNFWISTEKDREELERWQNRIQQYIMAKYGKKSANLLSGEETFGVTSGFVSAQAGITSPTFASPLTTKGDIFGFSTVDARIPVGADTLILTADSSDPLGVSWQIAGGGTGNVVGPLTATDNAIARFDGTTGEIIQNSGVLIDDSDNVTGVTSIAIGNSTWVISEDISDELLFTSPTGDGSHGIKVVSDTGEILLQNIVSTNNYTSLLSTSFTDVSSSTTAIAFSIQSDITTASDTGTEPITQIQGKANGGAVGSRPIFGFYNFNTKLWEINNDGTVDMQTNSIINVSLTTPTITDFTNAIHDHINSAGGGQLLSTFALSDTADIAYLNTANVYAAGTRQNFLGDTSGTSGINVGGIAGNPTTQADGDVWLNTSSNTLFGRINGADIDLGQSGTSGIESINTDTNAAQIIEGTATHITVGTTSGTTTINIGSNVATLTDTQLLTNKSITYSGRAQWNKGADVISSSTLTLGADGNLFTVTGTTTINEILATGWQAGSVVILEFTTTLTVTNNSGGTNDIILGDGANYTTAAGESLELWFDGNDWREISRSIGIGGGGTGITSINANSNAAQFITGVTNEIVIDSGTTPGTTNISLGSLVALSSDDLGFFASTTSSVLAGVISDETGTGGLVFAITPTLTTPVIGDFTNAAHSHENTVGAGNIISTLALSDTADIAYLNTANTWTTGLQNFSAASLRIPVSTTPSVTVDGDIAFDSVVSDFTTGLIRFFGTEEQGMVSMPIAQFTNPTNGFVVSYNAFNDEFELVAAGIGSGDVVGPVSATDNAITRFDGTSGTLIQNGVITIDDIANVESIRSLQFITHTSPPSPLIAYIAVVDNDFEINVTTGNNFKLEVNEAVEFEYDSTSANFFGNNLIMGTAFIQYTSIGSPGATGDDTVGKLFLDVGNSNHLSIIRNASPIDLEEITFPINFPQNVGGTATATQDISFSDSDRHSQQFTLTQDTTLTFSGTVADTTEYIDLFIIQDGAGNHTLTLPVGTINKAEVEAGINLGSGEETFILLKFAFGTFYAFLQGIQPTAGSQTPWLQNIDGAGFDLSNVGTLNLLIDDTTAIIELEANHTTPADGQIIGQIDFYDDDDGGTRTLYGKIKTEIQSPSDPNERSIMKFQVQAQGGLATKLSIDGTSNVKILDTLDMGGNVIVTSGTVKAGLIEITSQADGLFFETGSEPVNIISAEQTDDAYTITIPELFGDQEMVVTLGAQTLENKTLTAPIFADLGFIADANGIEMLAFDTVATAVNFTQLANSDAGNQLTLSALGTDTDIDFRFIPKGTGTFYGTRETWAWPLSDETTVLTTGVKFTTEPAPYDMTIEDAIGGLTTAGTGVALFTIDVLKETSVNGNVFSSIFTTDLVEIDASEFTSTTAATQPNITTTTWEKGRRLQLSISILDTNGLARGAKVSLIVHATAK